MRKLLEEKMIQGKELQRTNEALQGALDEIKNLHNCLPLCSYCKKIRLEDGSWEQVDVFIHRQYDAEVSHGICPDCMTKHHPDV